MKHTYQITYGGDRKTAKTAARNFNIQVIRVIPSRGKIVTELDVFTDKDSLLQWVNNDLNVQWYSQTEEKCK